MAPRRKSAAADRRVTAADEAAQERGPARIRPPRLADDYVSTIHPETGVKVTFVPGEALPDWVEVPR